MVSLDFRIIAETEAGGRRVEVFGEGENLLNRQIEDSKTPTTTLGMPRVGRIGILLHLGGFGS